VIGECDEELLVAAHVVQHADKELWVACGRANRVRTDPRQGEKSRQLFRLARQVGKGLNC
jgi:hypothetical protein